MLARRIIIARERARDETKRISRVGEGSFARSRLIQPGKRGTLGHSARAGRLRDLPPVIEKLNYAGKARYARESEQRARVHWPGGCLVRIPYFNTVVEPRRESTLPPRLNIPLLRRWNEQLLAFDALYMTNRRDDTNILLYFNPTSQPYTFIGGATYAAGSNGIGFYQGFHYIIPKFYFTQK